MDLYQKITNQIIEKLEEGVIPWRRPYSDANYPVNWNTGKMYRGINLLLLDGGEYATFKQIKKANGKIKKGEKAHTVVFWKMVEVKDEDSDNPKDKKKVPMLRTYNVFEINTQVEGLESKREVINNNNEPIEDAKKLVNNYFTKQQTLKFNEKPGVPCYIPSDDQLCMPNINDFVNSEEYYSTFFHEMVHSTGHKDRLNREGVTGKIAFGSINYSKEELTAEIGASMLSAEAQIDTVVIDNSASYIGNWLKVLRDDKTFVVKAAQKAQKAIDYILDKQYEHKGGE